MRLRKETFLESLSSCKFWLFEDDEGLEDEAKTTKRTHYVTASLWKILELQVEILQINSPFIEPKVYGSQHALSTGNRHGFSPHTSVSVPLLNSFSCSYFLCAIKILQQLKISAYQKSVPKFSINNGLVFTLYQLKYVSKSNIFSSFNNLKFPEVKEASKFYTTYPVQTQASVSELHSRVRERTPHAPHVRVQSVQALHWLQAVVAQAFESVWAQFIQMFCY